MSSPAKMSLAVHWTKLLAWRMCTLSSRGRLYRQSFRSSCCPNDLLFLKIAPIVLKICSMQESTYYCQRIMPTYLI